MSSLSCLHLQSTVVGWEEIISKNQTRKSFSTLKMEYIYHHNMRYVYLFMSFSLKKLHWETNKENSKSESGKYKEENVLEIFTVLM